MPPNAERKPPSGFITFNDFSAGIFQRTGISNASAGPAAIGAAQVANTYRCISLPGGGLGPLPGRTIDFNVTDCGLGNVPATAIVQAMRVMPLMYANAGAAPPFPPLAAYPFELHIMFEYPSAGNQIHEWRAYKYMRNSNVLIAQRTQAATGRYGVGWLNMMRMYHPSPTDTVGYPVMVGTYQTPNDPQVANTDYCWVYPDPTSGATVQTNTPYQLDGGGNVMRGMNTTHQNRLIVCQRGLDAHGDLGTSWVSSNERFRFTIPNDYTQDVPSTTTIFGQEVPVGYGVVASITASDLLLIKHTLGAFLVQGDLINPVVRRLPNVMGTGGLEQVAGYSMIGLVYGSRDDGVFVWGGGDTAAQISLQLEDGFWQLAGTTPYNFGGVFRAWGDLIVCPNNYVYDTTSKSWWRLEDPSFALYGFYDREATSNVLIATPATVPPSGRIASSYSQVNAAKNFSWNSQPFALAPRRLVQLREIIVTAQGPGTVTITFSSDSSPVVQPSVVNISSGTPTMIRSNISVQGTQFNMRIVADGGSNPAPIVYSVEVPFYEISDLPND